MNATTIALGVLPSAGVLTLFVLVMRGIIRADRNEREAIARLEADQAAQARRLTESHGD